ncbi:uncharacterized protein LOC131605350 [Vicia villosa]|uniref:uncharacterized protein LOC131605350 n=1 Tax=Vicia villosa TaxID=3911 RepID=UPI00273AB0F3|nr:uncharacterized protein LOC131605350 [Vicia villosa]
MEDPNHPQIADDTEPDVPTPATTARRGNKRKKTGPKRTATQKKRFKEKCQAIVETLKPIPFKPAKALDFDSHQSLLECLGLWGFVHIEFDSVIRTDLLAQLIVSYSPTGRCSYVNDIKVMVNRAELGRALKLPKKIPASAVPIIAVDEVDKEDIDFLNQLVSNWMLLHDDTFMKTKDIMQLINFVKDGTFEKVDWAGLIWSMLEKELKAPNLANCYYASHLQHLIKSQHKELLEETPVEGEGEEGVAKDEEEEGEVKDEEEDEEVAVITDEVDGSGDVRMGGVEESNVCELDESNTELSLKQEDNVETLPVERQKGDEEQIMDFEPSKEEEFVLKATRVFEGSGITRAQRCSYDLMEENLYQKQQDCLKLQRSVSNGKRKIRDLEKQLVEEKAKSARLEGELARLRAQQRETGNNHATARLP